MNNPYVIKKMDFSKKSTLETVVKRSDFGEQKQWLRVDGSQKRIKNMRFENTQIRVEVPLGNGTVSFTRCHSIKVASILKKDVQ